jgi:LysR family transcriptional regulator, carnitine catabolism transcriptional activator
VDRRQLEYFLAVAAHGSFTSAAAALRIAQPSLSHAVKAVEREVGAQLFHRLSRGVTLTAAGEALVRPAQQVLRDFAAARASVQMVSDLTAGRIDIVAQTTLAVHPLAGLVGAFRKAHPGVAVAIDDPEHAEALADMVRSGRSELGLTDSAEGAGDLRSYDLPDQQILVVLPPDAGIGPRETLTVAQVVAFDLIVTPPGTASRALLEFALSSAGAPLRVAVETPHRAAIVPLVLAGAGVTLLPRSMAEDAARQGARIAALDPPVVRRVRLLRRREPLSPAARAFVGLVLAEADRNASAFSVEQP